MSIQSEKRIKTLEYVSGLILAFASNKAQIVAVDGVDGSGKTMFADELVSFLQLSSRKVIRASVDGFHNPRVVRYRNGKTPESFYRDSYDYEKLKEELLDPFKKGGDSKCRLAVFDHLKDSPILNEKIEFDSQSILVFDGIFLHRPELRAYWDFSIFLDVDFGVSIPRIAQRDKGFGSPDPAAESNRRYVEGQKIYLAECEPKKLAHLVIDNNDLSNPMILN